MYGGTSALGAYQSIGFAGVADTVFSGTSFAEWHQPTKGADLGHARWLHPQLGSLLEHLDLRCLCCRPVQRHCLSLCSARMLQRWRWSGPGFSCNPNFNIGQIGTKTAWTPVKNLTFSGEVVYTQLDQKYSGQVALPAITATGKPAANYELKDQGTWSFLARAQRNF